MKRWSWWHCTALPDGYIKTSGDGSPVSWLRLCTRPQQPARSLLTHLPPLSFLLLSMYSTLSSRPSTLRWRTSHHSGRDACDEQVGVRRITGGLAARPASAASVYTGAENEDGTPYMVRESRDWALRTDVTSHLLVRRDTERLKLGLELRLRILTPWRVLISPAYEMYLAYTRLAWEDAYVTWSDHLDVDEGSSMRMSEK